ncbi:hypothetical protein K8Q96_01115, partial [Candidatus Nomurabacteria bacterium]|nr:hypothetical protein [Candidatus Nomurabacteria bacterium]
IKENIVVQKVPISTPPIPEIVDMHKDEEPPKPPEKNTASWQKPIATKEVPEDVLLKILE